jgi:hypothetical protein
MLMYSMFSNPSPMAMAFKFNTLPGWADATMFCTMIPRAVLLPVNRLTWNA